MKDEDILGYNFGIAVQGLSDEIVMNKQKWYDHINSLPQYLQAVYTIVVFHQEVFNGGLHQYFSNASGQFAYLTLQHLKLINATNAFEILNDAIKEVNKEGYSAEEFGERVFYRKIDRITAMDENLMEYLNTLDTEYYNLEDQENVEYLLSEYLRDVLPGST